MKTKEGIEFMEKDEIKSFFGIKSDTQCWNRIEQLKIPRIRIDRKYCVARRAFVEAIQGR